MGLRPSASRRFGVSGSQSLRYLARTVYLTPLLIGLASVYLFAAVPQMQEVYLSLIEEADFGRGLAGLAAIALFSAFLYVWNQIEVTARIDAIYPDHADIAFDARIFEIRDAKSAFAASLPFFGLLLGLAQVYRHVGEAARTGLIQNASTALPELSQAVADAAFLVLAVYLALLIFFYRLGKRNGSQKALLRFGYALTALLIVVPLVSPDETLIGARLGGPLAITALVLIELAVLVRLSLFIFQRLFRLVLALPSGFVLAMNRVPSSLRQGVLALVPLTAVGLIAAAIVSADGDTESEPEETAVTVEAGRALAPAFSTWLAERKTGAARYPVFIVAAQGGGIYAASTAATFLAEMQDHCPAFARHVFAISAVSGGSVGASLFNAAFADSIERGTNRKAPIDVEPGCDSLFATQGELSTRLRRITNDDHISPVLAYLVPDLVKSLVPAQWRAKKSASDRLLGCDGIGLGLGSRERILEKSFVASFVRTAPSPGAGETGDTCSGQDQATLLERPFSQGWSPKADLPALLLNATWVETGYRVAFSPFGLRDFGGGTLYSLDNLAAGQNEPSLIGAAVISTRFPGLMPPWSVAVGPASRISLVDGGYADSSGAETALQLYNKLKQLGGDDIDLYLITLTDQSKALPVAPGQQTVGLRNGLDDAVSPMTTLLSIRELQARKAVTGARNALGEKMIVIQLDQKAFPLPLGWKLSRLSSDIIRLTLGDPSRCLPVSSNSGQAVSIAGRNACELKRIVDLIGPKVLSPKAPSALSPVPNPLSTQFPAPVFVNPDAIDARAAPPAASPKRGAARPKVLGAWEPTSQ